STVYTHLTVRNASLENQSITICNGDNYIINSHIYYNSGIYYDTLITPSGCDSIIVTTLATNPVYTDTNRLAICQGDSITFNNHTYYQTGLYHDNYSTVHGCDSLIVTDLTVNNLPNILFPHPDDVCIDIAEV